MDRPRHHVRSFSRWENTRMEKLPWPQFKPHWFTNIFHDDSSPRGCLAPFNINTTNVFVLTARWRVLSKMGRVLASVVPHEPTGIHDPSPTNQPTKPRIGAISFTQDMHHFRPNQTKPNQTDIASTDASMQYDIHILRPLCCSPLLNVIIATFSLPWTNHFVLPIVGTNHQFASNSMEST